MTAHGEVVRSYEPEDMEPTKKQRFCALVHGSARLDDHAAPDSGWRVYSVVRVAVRFLAQ